MVMWRLHPNPMTDEERQREIRRLEAVRDQLLHVAPMHFYLRRLLLPIMLAMTLFVLWHTASTRSLDLTIGPTLLLTGFLVVVCYAAWKFWKSPPIPADNGNSLTGSNTRAIVFGMFNRRSTSCALHRATTSTRAE